MVGGDNMGSRQAGNWDHRLADDLKVFRATEGWTERAPVSFRVETALRPTTAKKGGKRYRGVDEAADRFM